MKIQVEKEIFDDPEYCSISGTFTSPSDKCGHGSLSLCNAFVDREFSPTFRHHDQAYGAFRKCDQCKAAWLKAKETQDQIEMLKESPLDPMHPNRNK